VLKQYERQDPTNREDKSCRSGYRRGVAASKLTVFNTREVVYESVEHTFCDGDPVRLPPRGTEWDFQPSQASTFRYMLSIDDYGRLIRFLDRPEIKAVDGFMNAAPAGVGDFKIFIYRGSRVQEVGVLALMPNHLQFEKDPSLLHLVCKAKEMAEVASFGGAARPDWCLTLKPLPDPSPGL